MLRTRSWLGEGSRPAAAAASATASASRTRAAADCPAPSVPACRCRTRPRCAPAPRVGRPRSSRRAAAAAPAGRRRQCTCSAPDGRRRRAFSSRQRRPVQDGAARRRGHGQLPVVDAPPADVGERGADPSVQRGLRAHHPSPRSARTTASRVRCLGGGLPAAAAAVAVQPEGRAAVGVERHGERGGSSTVVGPAGDSMLVSCHPEPASGVLAAPDSPQVTMPARRRVQAQGHQEGLHPVNGTGREGKPIGEILTTDCFRPVGPVCVPR